VKIGNVTIGPGSVTNGIATTALATAFRSNE
jgi:hypothetical protein